MQGVSITSDIGPLKRVMLHRPGKELLNLIPRRLEDLLFDDIGSELKIKEIQRTRTALLESLETYFRVFFLGEKIEEV